MLLQTYDDWVGDVSQTAKKLGRSPNTVKKEVRRHRQNRGLQTLSRRAPNSPGQNSSHLQDLVEEERKKTDCEPACLAKHLH